LKRKIGGLVFLSVLFLGQIVVYFLDETKAVSILSATKSYLLEMLSILPPILILVGLFEVWVPKSMIEKFMGETSGWKGVLAALFVGTAGMGPLYVAFPLGVSLLRKGASIINVSIFLYVWAAIKIPMILFEIKSLGLEFAVVRLALTIPCILAISGLLGLLVKRMDIPEA
jgi:uncharacterized membrane protein YraQ (UPF0718 family)